MVHLCGKRYAPRAGNVREIKVYTNQESVTLYRNGEKIARQAPMDHIRRFKLSPEHPMWNMVGNFNMDPLLGMNGEVPENVLKGLNKQPIQFNPVE